MYVLLQWLVDGLHSVINYKSILSPRKEFEDYQIEEIVKANFSGTPYSARVIAKGTKEDLKDKMALTASSSTSMKESSSSLDATKPATSRKRQALDKEPEKISKIKKNDSAEDKLNKEKKEARQKKLDVDKRKNDAAILLADSIISKRREMPALFSLDHENPADSYLPQHDNDTNYSVFPPLISQSYQLLLDGTMEDERPPECCIIESLQTPLDRIQQLQDELETVKQERDMLRREVQILKQAGAPDLNATPTKISFLKDLTRHLESKNGLESLPTLHHVTPKLPRKNLMTNTNYQNISDKEMNNLALSSPTSDTGAKKFRLLSDHQIFVTSQQMSLIKQLGINPRKLMNVLLDMLFSKDILAISSAKGSRRAVNKASGMDSRQLDVDIIAAIKEYTLREFKKDGKACMCESDMNNLINTKCASARRNLKKMT
ncbi:uncharacterized protein LOC121384526 isoform X2 [Gigantopelta aegis]|uniref:uncharacterized protein LOC121384526 isoform X2 n=1 Tax=Gigantopelta aegis TaxID=1735272 RepID=UPI001B88AA27|nr:uncharacterized protein LOC121384526 isoform X2 [Gigantopelta aegis]